MNTINKKILDILNISFESKLCPVFILHFPTSCGKAKFC